MIFVDLYHRLLVIDYYKELLNTSNSDSIWSLKRGFSGIEQLYFDISLDLDTAPQNRQEIFQQKLTQLLSTGEYLLRKVDCSLD